jgi:hypothetical protein
VTTAKRPFPGWDVASDSADLPDGLSETFFAEGLDSPDQFEIPAKISLCTHWIFYPIYGIHAPHLASPRANWVAGIRGTMRLDEMNRT